MVYLNYALICLLPHTEKSLERESMFYLFLHAWCQGQVYARCLLDVYRINA